MGPSTEEATSDTPGYDRPAVENWLAEHTDAVAPPLEWERLEGGHSNLTFRLIDTAGAVAVIRRPPLGDLLPKAHDMEREFTVISALNGTGVPVPEPLALCTDPSITGAVFYVMGEVGGRALYTAEAVEEWLDLEARGRVGPAFIDTLARLHQLDPAEIGLGDLARHDGYVARQLKTWYGSWQASIPGAELDDVRIHDLHAELMADLPDQGPARIVHGDYGMHNVMVAADGSVAAVLDWEIATLGDPMADFAYAMNGWFDPADAVATSHETATQAPGFSPRTELIERYAEITGRSMDRLGYYRRFNYFKTACILHGVYARYRQGKKSADGVDLDLMRQRLLASIQMATEHL